MSFGFNLKCLIKLLQSEMFATAPESEGEEWEGGREGWEEDWGAGMKCLHYFASKKVTISFTRRGACCV